MAPGLPLADAAPVAGLDAIWGLLYVHALRATLCIVALLAWLLLGCGAERPTKVPGETDITVSEVVLESATDDPLTPDYSPLMDRLGMRAASLVLPGRYYSEFREAEDRRRITAFWQTHGFFDVEVAEPALAHDREEQSVAITWRITENERYSIAAVHLENAPPAHQAALAEMIYFEKGTQEIDLEGFRQVRVVMAEYLRDEGYGHAEVYSRAFVDREDRVIHWYYYVDAGPETVVGEITVDEGAVKVPPDIVKERVGLSPGDPYSYDDKIQRELDLLDTGAYASTFIRTTADTKFLVPGDAPDTGGIMVRVGEEKPQGAGLFDLDGKFVPRQLDREIDLKIHVVEAPSQQLRVRATAEADPVRLDTALGARLWLRNLFGPLHHLTVSGRIGFGYLYRSATDDPTGLYGEAQIQYLKPMLLGRLGDFRLTARFRDELYDAFHLREVTAGPGVRTTITKGLFFDIDALFRFGQQVDFGPFDPPVRDTFKLADQDEYLGGELVSSIIWDERDNPVESLRGHLLALRAAFSPGGVTGWNRYLSINPEARGFLPIVDDTLSLGAKLRGDWVFLDDGQGIPLGPRLFGGGGYGVRGLGRNQLSPFAPSCRNDPVSGERLVCQGVPVGGLSMVESSLEARFLPALKPYGVIAFADVGGVSETANPFAEGVTLAAGLGLRLRLWYLPAAFDFGYRILQDNEVQAPADDPFVVFFRIGEAF